MNRNDTDQQAGNDEGAHRGFVRTAASEMSDSDNVTDDLHEGKA